MTVADCSARGHFRGEFRAASSELRVINCWPMVAAIEARGVGGLAQLIALCCCLALLLLSPRSGAAQEASSEEVQALLDEAKAKRAELLSPESFGTALGAWEKAQENSQGGQSSDRMQKNLAEAAQAFKKAIQNAEQVSFTFPELIRSRDDAQAQKASELAVESFKKADQAFGNIVALMERGDLARARTKAPEAERALRLAELDAIQAEILGAARKLQDQAGAIGSPNKAPVSFQKAQEALKEAENFISANRYEKDAAQARADSVAYQFRHAIHVTEWAASLKKGDANWEKLILQFEQELRAIGETLHLQLEFDQDIDIAAEAIMAAIRSLQEDRQHLQEELSERDTRIGELEAEVGKLEAQTGKYAAELEAKREELEKRKHLEEKIGKLKDLFRPEEGTVLQAGNQVIIRLTGLRFSSGSSAVRSENFALLTKAQRAIREFPDRHIEVQGHTDSQGDDQANLELSQKRAQAVRIYLMQNMNLAEDDVTAVGLGESQPIASNDAASGRAANRRIEIVLEP